VITGYISYITVTLVRVIIYKNSPGQM